MSESRSAAAWGVALVTVGAALLLRNTGAIAADVAVWPWAVIAAGVVLLVVPTNGSRDLGLALVLVLVGGVFALRGVGWLPVGVGLAPVALIAAGVWVLSRALGSWGEEQPVSTASMPLDGETTARLTLTYGAGTLRLAGGAGPGVLYEGTFVGGLRQEVKRSGDRLDATLRHGTGATGVLGWRSPLDWDLRVTEAVPIDLEVVTGASRVDLDLSSLRVRFLKLETGASDVDVVLPAHGTCRVEIEAGAADVVVRVPESMAASVRTSTALASVDVDSSRFPRQDGVYRSVGYDGATDRADIRIDGGLASFAVR